MSAETSTWLNQNTLIGFTDKRGQAWHYRASDQGDEPNHYPRAIPMDDVIRRLFNWQPLEGTVETSVITDDGVARYVDDSRKAIVRSDTGKVLGVFRPTYQPHDYKQWLLANVETILDADLAIGSAGLLRDGAVAWVQVEMEDTIETPEGVAFRPFLTAATSLDGSLASTYQTGAQVVVCDNTLGAALSRDKETQVKIRHSARSLDRIQDVRDALGIVHSVADTFAAEVADLTRRTVTDKQWEGFLEEHFPIARDTSRGRKSTEARRDEMTALYRADDRVAPWKGTAYGVVAAVNTYYHHVQPERGDAHRAERNMTRAVRGEYADLGVRTMTQLDRVLANV